MQWLNLSKAGMPSRPPAETVPEPIRAIVSGRGAERRSAGRLVEDEITPMPREDLPGRSGYTVTRSPLIGCRSAHCCLLPAHDGLARRLGRAARRTFDGTRG